MRLTRSSGRLTHLAVRALDGAARLLLPVKAEPQSAVTGRRGEEDAYFHLRRQGYVMVARNFRSPRRKGEIDLIGWDGEWLCFIEVKTRTSHDVMPAEAAVDEEKRRDLSLVAREYLRRAPEGCRYRFDIVSIYYERGGGAPQVALFKNAFALS